MRHSARALRALLQLLPSRARDPVLRPILRLIGPRGREAVLAGTMPWLRPAARISLAGDPLAGLQWFPAASVPACAAGTYERETQHALRQHLRPGGVMFDIGANVGFFTLFASQLVGTEGSIVAFEPLPDSLAWLRRHVAVNSARNVRIVEAAVSDRSGKRPFAPAASNAMGRLAGDGTFEVDVVTLDEYVSEAPRAPDLLKIDVEGEEVAVLRGASELLGRHRPALVVATHGIEAHHAALALLQEHDYDVHAHSLSGAADESHRGSLVATQRPT